MEILHEKWEQEITKTSPSYTKHPKHYVAHWP